MIWRIGLWCHKNIRSSLFWRAWWWVGYHGVYEFMWSAKARGWKFAQPMGEGYPELSGEKEND